MQHLPPAPIARSLLWKEYREHRYKMLGILLTCLAFLCASRLAHYDLAIFQFTINLLALLIPPFLAMETLTEERTSRTHETTLSLPIPASRVFFHKCLWDMATASLPMLAVQLLGYYLVYGEPPRFTGYQPAASWLMQLPAATCCFYAWIVLICARFHSQLKVAIVSFLIFIAHVVILYAVESMLYGSSSASNGAARITTSYEVIVCAFSPLGPYLFADRTLLPLAPLTSTAATLVSLLLLAFASRRYVHVVPQRAALRQRRSPSLPKLRRHAFPILWKTWAESRAFVLLYLLATVILVVLNTFTLFNEHMYRFYGQFFVQVRYFHELTSLLSFGALFVALIIAGNIGMADFEHHLDQFWQSRPIGPSRYFYKRFFSGLLLVLLVYLLPNLLHAGLASIAMIDHPYSDRPLLNPHDYGWTHLWYIRSGTELEAFWALPELCLFYGISVFSAAFLRHRVLAMLLSILLFFLLPIGTSLQETVMNLGLLYRSVSISVPPMYHLAAYLLLTALVLPATLLLAKLASLPFLHDWKSHLEQRLSRLHAPPPSKPLTQTT